MQDIEQDIEQTEQELTALIVRIVQNYPLIPEEWQHYEPPFRVRFDEPEYCQGPESEELVWALKSHGFYFVGSGCFGLVIGHDDTPDTVYKISARLNDAYGAFALYARQMQGNPHLPVIRELQTGSFFMVVALERLYPIDDENRELCWAVSGIATSAALGDEYDIPGEFEEHVDFLETAADIGRYFYGVATIDIHEDNIMQREDGTPVITDPVSYTKG